MLDELFSIPTSTPSPVGEGWGEGKTTASSDWPPTSTDSVPKPPTNSQWTDYRSNAPISSGTERDYFRSTPTKATTPISTPTKTATNRWLKSFTTTKDEVQYLSYFHNDQIGIPREMTDIHGNLVWLGLHSDPDLLNRITRVMGAMSEGVRKELERWEFCVE